MNQLLKENLLKLENERVKQLDEAIRPWEAIAMDENGRVIDKEAYRMWQLLTKVRNRSACIADELSQEIAEERMIKK